MKPETLNELALFAGAGGGILGGKLRGWRTVCAVEWDAYARDVLVARQNDGCLEGFPIWDDIQTFDGRPWRGRVDVVSGGFPCQDISAAGKGAGIEGERSGMWKHMARVVGEILPRYVFVENSPMLVGRGLAVVIADLAEMGYDVRWGVVGAHHAGAPHKRDRIWLVAYRQGIRRNERKQNRGGSRPRMGERKKQGSGDDRRNVADAESQRTGDDSQDHGVPDHDSTCGCCGDVADASGEGLQGGEQPGTLRDERDREKAHGSASECSGSPGSTLRHAASAGLPHGIDRSMGQPGTLPQPERPDWWATEPNVGRVAHGVAARVDRLRCIGNGQVPAVVPLAWNLLRPTRNENS